jgi:AraC-like DNA-binding protein
MQGSCSARLVQHLLRSLALSGPDRQHIPPKFWSVDPDSRVPLADAHAPLTAATERLADDALGLKLGMALRFGAGGAFDYAVRSAATLRESVEVASRFAPLVADTMGVSFEVFRNQAVIRLDVDPVWPKVIADFAASAWFRIHLAGQLRQDAHLQCWFPQRAPDDTSVHERVFEGTALRFDAPLLGFALECDHASAPMPGADPVLHSSHRERLESLLAGLNAQPSTSVVVRQVIERELRCGRPTAADVARALGMSRSTLARRLDSEGTDFTREIDGVRRARALKLVGDSHAVLAEVAYLCGFSHVESFHCAFKRWTGKSPLAYRELLGAARETTP